MYHQAAGALHMHTVHSDGTGTIEEVARAARRSGLQWIWITDHDTLEGKADEGIVEGVVTLVGYEITPRRNHYLVGDLDELVSRDLAPSDYVEEVGRRGGVGVIAHPDERAINEYTEPYRWEDWSLRGFTGIELWNYMSDWIEHYHPYRKYLDYFFPSLALKGPTPETVQWWDDLQMEGGRPTGLFGVDVHALRVKRFGKAWTVFPYEHCFQRLVNFLVLDEPLAHDFETAQRQIWSAIRRGRVLMANQGRGDAAGSTFLAHPHNNHTIATCGDEISLGDGLTLEFVCPLEAEIRLYHNGTQVARTARSQKLRFDCTEPGHYRVEAHRRTLWIMTNHIHVV